MKKRILVVDDSPFYLEIMDDMLSNLDYDVITAANGIKACEQVESGPFDLIFTDLHMPQMNGIEFVKQVKQTPNCRFIPIVMLSSEGDEGLIEEAKQTGISTFLRKPIKEPQLKAILQVAVGPQGSRQSA